MIKVSITKKDNVISKIAMTGHANHDEYGKDIVCAAASSIAITSVNAILKINEKAITVNEDDGGGVDTPMMRERETKQSMA